MAKLKGYSGIRPGVTQDLTPDFYEDMPEAERPVFTVSFATVTEKQEMYDRFYQDDGKGYLELKPGTKVEAMAKVIRSHVKGHKNWPDEFKTTGGEVDADLYETYDVEIRNFLYKSIMAGVSEEEANAVKS